MKDEYKILIGAIIVILIVLVGVFALSGSGNPGPTVTPTVAPTTNPAPTAMPGGEGGNTPSATPTVTPTATPVPMPTTEPESGVKLTEFGYWITYPPLGPQNWSTNPPPNPGDVTDCTNVSIMQTSGFINYNDGAYNSNIDYGGPDSVNNTYIACMAVTRHGGALGVLNVPYTYSHTNADDVITTSGSITFDALSDETYLELDLPLDFITNGYIDKITIELSDATHGEYNVYPNKEYILDINNLG